MNRRHGRSRVPGAEPTEPESMEPESAALMERPEPVEAGGESEQSESSRVTGDDVQKLADAMLFSEAPPDHSHLPAGFTYLGQFVAHDMTMSVPALGVSRSTGRNARDPRLELDSLYGLGPRAHPYFYGRSDPSRLRLGTSSNETVGDISDVPETDLFRLPSTGEAVIADPRNDDNLITAQLHVAFSRFHNAVAAAIADDIADPEQRFLAAREIVVSHYQRVVTDDFLGRLLLPDVWEVLFGSGASSPCPAGSPPIPPEFALAGFRLHTLVRTAYDANAFRQAKPVGDFLDRAGTEVATSWLIDWRRFFPYPGAAATPPQMAAALDTQIAPMLGRLEDRVDRQHLSLPHRTLARGQEAGIASGQCLASGLNLPVLSECEINTTPDGRDLGLSAAARANTPLFYYLMREAELQPPESLGRLGPLGSWIVGCTFRGMLPPRTPDPPRHLAHCNGFAYERDSTVTMVDLLRFAPPNPWTEGRFDEPSDPQTAACKGG